MHKTVYSSDRSWLGGQIFSGCRLKEGNNSIRRKRHQRHLSSDHHHTPMMILLLLVVTLTAALSPYPGADAFQNAISSQPRRSCSHRLSTRCNTATTLIDDMCESSSVAVGSSPPPPTI